MMPKYVFKHDPDTGSLYLPFYYYFLRRWNNPDIPEYDLETDELIYRDLSGNEARREKFDGMKIGLPKSKDPINKLVPRRENEREDKILSFCSLPYRVFESDLSNSVGKRDLSCGLHPGGKEFIFLRSKRPLYETAGLTTIL